MDPVLVYDVVVFAHIVAATVLLGTSFLAPLSRAVLRRAPTAGQASTWLAIELRMTMLNPFAALVVLASGLYLGSLIGWPSGWFAVSVAAFFINALVAMVFARRLHERLGAELSGDPEAPISAEADRHRWSIGWEIVNGVLLANDLALLFLMIRQPELGLSIGTLVAFNAVVVPLGFLLRRPATSRQAVAPATPDRAASELAA